jgi:hypothetical protein
METLRGIEKNWTAPMANSVETRVRFAMWDAMRIAAGLATGKSRKVILDALHADEALFDESGSKRVVVDDHNSKETSTMNPGQNRGGPVRRNPAAGLTLKGGQLRAIAARVRSA